MIYRKTAFLAIFAGLQLGLAGTYAETSAPQVPSALQSGKDGVKAYLLKVCAGSLKASHDLKTDADQYVALLAKHGNDPAAAARDDGQTTAQIIRSMRDAYMRIDSYGYEYMEGIVAGVPSLIKYDVELDSGLPKSMATGVQDQVAPVVIHAGDLTIDHEGSLNNFLIEPTVYGTNPRFVAATASLPGFEKPVGLPKPALVEALADYSIDGYSRLLSDAKAWNPTDADCFHAIYNMTPTLADYFDDWKESKKNGYAVGGRFVAVSRVSDMRGIMASVQLTWTALEPQITAKDPALADNVTHGYEQIMTFINTIDDRDQKKPLNVETIDALGAQAKDRADKLTVQTSQSAALLGIDVNEK